MGIYDRDYYRDDARRGLGALGPWAVTVSLIVINVVVFVADGLMVRAHEPTGDEMEQALRAIERGRAYYFGMGPIQRWGYFSMDTAVYAGQVWRFVTFQFLHAGAGHLALNMLGLLFFAPVVEGHFGARRFLAYYLLCGVAGAALYIILWAAGLVITSAAVPLVGASAGVLGVMVAASQFAPDIEVGMLYLPIPLRLRTLVWITLIGAAYAILRRGFNAGGEAAHVGGIVCGFLLVYNQHLLNFVAPSRRALSTSSTRARRRPNRVQKDWSKDLNR